MEISRFSIDIDSILMTEKLMRGDMGWKYIKINVNIGL
jgi:hypothetical protein